MPIEIQGFDSISDSFFIAAWIQWQQDRNEAVDVESALASAMPIGKKKESIASIISKPNTAAFHGLDLLIRTICSDNASNAMLVTDSFLKTNGDLLEQLEEDVSFVYLSRAVDAVILSKSAQAAWEKLSKSEQTQLLLDAETAISADDDLKDEREEIIASTTSDSVDAGKPLIQSPSSPQSLVQALVEQIHNDTYQAYYRRKLHGTPILGWRNRLDAYFWPNPASNVAANTHRISQIFKNLTPLVQARIGDSPKPWTSQQKVDAAKITEEIFRWGGVTKSIKHITVNNVQATIDSAIHGSRIGNAPMNSAWTKLAAFASSIAGSDQAIWDSRVSHSIIKRLSRLGATRNDFLDLGWVGGQGGTRRGNQPYMQHWPCGYGSWTAHFAGAQLVREMRDVLNKNLPTFGEGNGASGLWTVRDVEMVLFMDGY